MERTFIICECGSNHNQDFNMALKMIDVAKYTGCDAVKFQLFKSDKLYSPNTPDFANYKNIPDLIKSLELPREWVPKLKKYCDDIGIEFFASPFDEEAVDLLVDIGVKRIKIAGFEATDIRFLKYILLKKIPIVISLGANISDNLLTTILEKIIHSNPNLIHKNYFMHAIQSYPAPLNEMCLNEMHRIKFFGEKIIQESTYHTKNNLNVGLSDHSEGILIPPVAVGMGAKIIEKHFTLDRNMIGPDHKFAIEPNELNEMVKNIRLIENSVGYRINLLNNSEKEFMKAKRAVYASQDIKKGEKFTEHNITTKRPFLKDYIPAEKYYFVLNNYRAKCDIIKNNAITRNNME